MAVSSMEEGHRYVLHNGVCRVPEQKVSRREQKEVKGRCNQSLHQKLVCSLSRGGKLRVQIDTQLEYLSAGVQGTEEDRATERKIKHLSEIPFES